MKIINILFKIGYILYLVISSVIAILLYNNYFKKYDLISNTITLIEMLIYSTIITLLVLIIRESNSIFLVIIKIFVIILMILLPYYYLNG